jgi:phosphosulfolactate phosphohydrolase-like enzyme
VTTAIPAIEILDFEAGARAARGIAVIIDVFRAFSVACYALANGAERIIPPGNIEEARRLKREHLVHTTHAGTQGLVNAICR